MSTLTITTIQTVLHWEDKNANFRMLEEKINAIQQRTELVILPEMFSTGFSMKAVELAEDMNGGAVRWMKRVSAERKIVLTGSAIIEEDGKYFNRLLWVLPNGTIGVYDKRHRFAFAGEDEHFTAGSKRLIASLKGWKILPLVCYDLRFPVWARQSGFNGNGEGPEYDLLIYVANWPERRIHAWKTLLQARAIENQAYVIGVNRTGEDGNQIHYCGDTMVVDPLGEVLYQQHEKEDVHTLTIDKAHLDKVRARFPFWKDADRFNIDV